MSLLNARVPRRQCRPEDFQGSAIQRFGLFAVTDGLEITSNPILERRRLLNMGFKLVDPIKQLQRMRQQLE